MPLKSIEDYERLAAHLFEIDAPLAAFASMHGYRVHRQGRYPNRWLTQEGTICRSIQITMGDGPSGERFDRFFPDIPYTIFGAAWLDEPSSHTRWSAPALRVDGVPFSALARELPTHLEYYHRYLSGVSEDYIRRCMAGSKLWTSEGEP